MKTTDTNKANTAAKKTKDHFVKKMLPPETYARFSKYKRILLKNVWLVRAALFIGAIVAILFIVWLILYLTKDTALGSAMQFSKSFVFAPSEAIEIIDGKTNILILGKGNVNHEAPDLTDSIIFGSITHEKKENGSSATLVSIPRDIWIPALRAKINSAYYWGNLKQSGGGLLLAKSLFSSA